MDRWRTTPATFVCTFCDIAKGTAPADIVAVWPEALAIRPLRPVADGHLLVIPRAHIRDAVADPHLTAAVMHRAAELALKVGSCNLIASMGREADQDALHFAIDLIPREHQDGDTPIPTTLDNPDCPVCLSYRVRRSGRALLTCGSSACAYEMRARSKRGGPYSGGHPRPSEEITYSAAHARARRQLRGEVCAEADETCSGRLEAALRPGLPAESLRSTTEGVMYYAGLDATVGYRNLCRSHHSREGQLMAALKRYPELQPARVAGWARKAHAECNGSCAVCSALSTYDAAASKLIGAVDAENDRLALPWTGQHRD